MEWLEILGTGIGLLYLYLEYRASVWLWIAGVIMPAIYIFVYYDAGLYADAGISVYYLLASLYGLGCWLLSSLKGSRNEASEGETNAGIGHIPGGLWWWLAGVVLLVTLLLGYILREFTDSSVPWADAFTTGLSVVAMWMLARKYVEQWLVWILADIGCAALYFYKGLYFTGGLYGVYAVIAWFGYRRWSSEL